MAAISALRRSFSRVLNLHRYGHIAEDNSPR